MSNIPDAVAVTELAIDVSDRIVGDSSNDNMRISNSSGRRRSSSKGRKSRSDSMGRKSSHRKINGNSHRHGSNHSPMRSSSRSAGSFSGSSEFWSCSDDGDGDLKRSSSRHSPRRKRSVSPKGFFEGEDEDTKPRTNRSTLSPNRSKRSITTRHSTDDLTATEKAKARHRARKHSTDDLTATAKARNRARKPGSDLVLTSWHSRSTASSRDRAGLLKAQSSRHHSGSKRSLKSGLENLSLSGESRGTVSTAQSLQTLYGNDEDAKAKAKASRRSGSKRSLNPGMEFVSPSGQSRKTASTISTLNTARSAEVLYGNDEDAKAKAKSSRRSGSKRNLKPGIDFVSPAGNTARNIEILYGDEDAKAKAKASSRSPKRSQLPGIQLVHENNSPSQESRSTFDSLQSRSTFKSLQSTEILYGMSDKDSKAKAKAAMLRSSSHRSRRSMDGTSPTEILYGNEADAKTKAKSSRSSSRRNIASNPGVEVVGAETESESRSSRSASPPSSVPDTPVEDESIPFQVEGSVVRKGKSKKQQEKQVPYIKWIILALVIVLIGGGATAFIALGSDDDEQAAQAQDSGIQDDATQDSNEGPKAPAGSPNSTPTAPPSEKVVRDPPSAEECDSIKNNSTTVTGGSNTVDPNNWNVNIQINVKDEKEGMTDEMLQELMDAIQELLLPSIAGCSVDQRKLMGMARPINQGASRELEVVFDQARFAILFGYVKGKVQADAVCADTPTPELCYIVLVEFALYLDSDITSAEVEDVILEELLEGNDIASKLDLGDSFLSANATNITNVTPLEAPSASPTDAPSASPSTSPTESPTVPSATNGPESPTVVPVAEPTDGPDSPTLLPVSEPSLGQVTPTVIPFDTPTSAPIESASPSSMPSDVPSTSPSEVPSTMPSTFPSTSPSFAPSPLPTVLPTVSSSNSPTSKPSAAPTVRASDLPTASPTKVPIVDSSAPSVPSPSASPSKSPTPRPTPYPSPRPSTPPPTRLVTPPPTPVTTPVTTPTECFCLVGESDPDFPSGNEDFACDGSEEIVEIGCDSCLGSYSCTGLRENQYNGTRIGTIGENSCLYYGACDNAMVVSIGNQTCMGHFSCEGRNIDAGSLSCTGTYACAAHYFNPFGKLIAGKNSCNGQYACYLHELTVESDSCSGDWACAGRTKMYVADTACTAQNACSGEVFTDGNIYQAQQQISFFGQGSCTCENCCVCMVKVVSGRCTTLGECCDVNFPASKVAGVLDNTDEELRQDFGVSDLNQLFLGGQKLLER